MTRPWDDDGWEPDQPDEEAINEAKRREGLLRERVEELRRREPYFLDDLDLMRELQFYGRACARVGERQSSWPDYGNGLLPKKSPSIP